VIDRSWAVKLDRLCGQTLAANLVAEKSWRLCVFFSDYSSTGRIRYASGMAKRKII
jgi:hypothetical protein